MMIILLDSNNLAFYIGQNFTVTEDAIVFFDGSVNTSYNLSNTTTINANEPNPSVDFAWQWDGSKWVVYNQEAIDAYYLNVENQQAQANKAMAILLLQQTDWTSVADVGNSAMSNPYLENQAEFIAWRSQVRAIAVTPVAGTPAIFNEMPQEVWQTV